MPPAKRAPIKIAPSKKGSFTKKAKAHGESVQQYAGQVLKPGSKASAATKKQANFARNSAGWSHARPRKSTKK